MNSTITIACKNLGMADEGYINGTSLEDLVDCVKRTMSKHSGTADASYSSDYFRTLVRSAIIQSCRPNQFRSVRVVQ